MKKKFIWMLGAFIVSGLTIVLLMVDASDYIEQKVTFEFKDNQLAAVLTIPKHQVAPYPVAIFVHGDSALPYDGYGYYKFFWNQLAKEGIASFSWDKAGVGGSSGNWLSQSMEDRAQEVIAAIDYLKTLQSVKADSIGLVGFSQAGWVLPLVSARSNYPDFMVIVSGAINWINQGDYMMRKRLGKAGFSEIEIQQAIEKDRAGLWVFAPDSSYQDYLNASSEAVPMTEERYEFVKRNWRSDARDSLKTIRRPFLAVFGEEDVNVDAAESAVIYQEILTASGHPDFTIKTFPNAQHGLLKADLFQTANPGIFYLLKLEVLGEKAFADGVLDLVIDWIVETAAA